MTKHYYEMTINSEKRSILEEFMRQTTDSSLSMFNEITCEFIITRCEHGTDLGQELCDFSSDCNLKKEE